MAGPGQPKTGGRAKGTPNRATIKRYDAMQRVNDALALMGDDTLSGMRLLQEVLRHPDTPLDVKIQCAGLLTKYEAPETERQKYVVCFPLPLQGGTQDEQMKEWQERYAKEMPDAKQEDRELHEKLAAQIIGRASKPQVSWVDPDIKEAN
jgi:hypothetical protein